MKTLRSECTDRGIDVEGCVKKTLEDNLTHDLRGIKRPIALLCTEEGRPSGLVQYMICQLEILHDLKSIIGTYLIFAISDNIFMWTMNCLFLCSSNVLHLVYHVAWLAMDRNHWQSLHIIVGRIKITPFPAYI